MRDEAHRFAITYHRNLREKTIRESVLDGIAGIGEAKKAKLLRTFRTIAGISRAGADEIMKTAGVAAPVANEILRLCRASAKWRGTSAGMQGKDGSL